MRSIRFSACQFSASQLSVWVVAASAVLSIFCAPIMTQAAPAPSVSVFFSAEELDLLYQASQGVVTGLEDESGTSAAQESAKDIEDRGRRILTLSGVVYQSSKDWTIWLNGERVTPHNIPEYVRGLVVKPDHIQLRWFDKANNRIVNITLHPHQHYNLDLDVISPGT